LVLITKLFTSKSSPAKKDLHIIIRIQIDYVNQDLDLTTMHCFFCLFLNMILHELLYLAYYISFQHLFL